MTPDEFTDTILGKPVKRVDTMPPPNCTSPPIIFEPPVRPVLRLTLTRNADGEMVAENTPENEAGIEYIKEFFKDDDE